MERVKTVRLSKYNGTIRLDDEYVFLYNMLTGVLDIVNNDTLAGLEAQRQDELYAELVERGYLTTLTEEEEIAAFTNMVSEKHTDVLKNKKHVIILTYNCNMRCSYCFEQHLLEKGEDWVGKTLTFEQIEQIYQVVDHFDALGDSKEIPITLFGGEPLLLEHRELVEKIFAEGHKRGRTFAIVTNGATIPEYLPLLKQYPISDIQITLDGPKEVHDQRRYFVDGSGSFEQVVEGIELLAQHGFKVTVKVAVDAENTPHLPRLFDLVRERGWEQYPNVKLHMAPVFAVKKEESQKYPRDKAMEGIFAVQKTERSHAASDSLNAFYTLQQVFTEGRWSPKLCHCQAGQGLTFYDPFGSIYCCWESIGRDDLIVGRYSPELTLDERYHQWVNRNISNIETCGDCEYSLLCGGGCALEMYETFGDFTKPNCAETKNVVLPKQIPFLYEKYVKPMLYK